ncbi:type I-F CRISPR-associated endoribonuclease Cas6/Csy4 [Moraxella nasovis]|uniref:type I-F CRISPR-associated endoribonuclease Cas6/Csy4 n=1 Tax=Moraxella nasovis TaxID=2904121 RepID=UPI001F610DC1|nr:type I-F CRISPR-associated endoribonuclease Cas6/Csy4 [Moraxella nasovis]UNU73187.1 type I-F CRISPR-associated endoribonuclease Cas6/Csy4 [Moraxella nasovis]
MNFYQEITLIPDAEISPYFLWSKVYHQLHIALADVKNKHGIDGIGISFPNYRFEEKDGKTFATLGTKLRIFANTEDELIKLDVNYRLERLTDYVHIKPIREVGSQAKGYVVVKRHRYKNFDKQVAKFAKFKGISLEESHAHCREHKQPIKYYPFITLNSETTQQPYQLSIWQEAVDSPVAGKFNTYGLNSLSGSVTVPHW